MDMNFHLKHINFLGNSRTIVCQNENGPCPLLALVNVLLLQNRINIHPDHSMIDFADLTELVVNCLIETSNRKPISTISNKIEQDNGISNSDSVNTLHSQQILNEVLTLLPSLINGLDLNIKFSGVTDFEFTRELSVFDSLNVPVYHGWVMDSQDAITTSIVQNLSYNQAVNKIVEYQSLNDSKVTQESQHSTQIQIQSGLASNNNVDDLKNQQQQSVEDLSNYIIINSNNLVDTGFPTTESETKTEIGPPHIAVDYLSDVAATTPCVTSNPNTETSSATTANQSVQQTITEGIIIQNFMNSTSSQLTFEGCHQLHSIIKPNQLCIFFRNNHFGTLFKHTDGLLYLLVTDQGYLKVPQIVWERISDINSSEYTDSYFQNFVPMTESQEYRTILDDGLNIITTTPPVVGTVVGITESSGASAAGAAVNDDAYAYVGSDRYAVEVADTDTTAASQQQQQLLLDRFAEEKRKNDLKKQVNEREKQEAERTAAKEELRVLMLKADAGESIDSDRLDFLLNNIHLDNAEVEALSSRTHGQQQHTTFIPSYVSVSSVADEVAVGVTGPMQSESSEQQARPVVQATAVTAQDISQQTSPAVQQVQSFAVDPQMQHSATVETINHTHPNPVNIASISSMHGDSSLNPTAAAAAVAARSAAAATYDEDLALALRLQREEELRVEEDFHRQQERQQQQQQQQLQANANRTQQGQQQQQRPSIAARAGENCILS